MLKPLPKIGIPRPLGMHPEVFANFLNPHFLRLKVEARR
jgi:hypothetical protein